MNSAPVVPAASVALVADDDPDIRMTLRHLFEAFGFEVYEAATVAEAVRQFRRVSPSVMTTDWDYGDGRYGSDLLEELRESILERGTVIVAYHGGDRLEADPYLEARNIPNHRKPTSLFTIWQSIERSRSDPPMWPRCSPQQERLLVP